MLIEAVKDPIRCRWGGGEVTLEPGQPVDLPEDRAKRLLKKAAGKVRLVKPTHVDWLAAWRELAAVTNGITRDEPRFQLVLAALSRCDDCYLAGAWPAFLEAAEHVRQAVQGRAST